MTDQTGEGRARFLSNYTIVWPRGGHALVAAARAQLRRVTCGIVEFFTAAAHWVRKASFPHDRQPVKASGGAILNHIEAEVDAHSDAEKNGDGARGRPRAADEAEE